MSTLLALLLAGGATAVAASSRAAALGANAASASSPKVVVTLLIDDLGAHDLGFTGSGIRTPNLDQLRSEGLALTNYWVQPICTPSRAALMTGRYPLALGLQGGLTIQPEQDWGVPLNETFLPQVLSGSGVRTHWVGKWHLGYSRWGYTPSFRGFGAGYGYFLGAEDYYTHSLGPGAGYDLNSFASVKCGAGCNEVVWSANGTYSTFLFAAEAQRVIAQHAAQGGDAPLFLYLAWQSVHSPVQAPASYVAPYRTVFNNTLRQVHAGALAVLDEAVGNVTAALAAAGLLDDTVMVVSTDNGGPSRGPDEDVDCGDCNGSINWPLRSGKHSLYSGGTLGTAWVWSAGLYGTSPANRSFAGLAHITDVFPTVLGWLNVSYQPRPGFELHGVDLGPALAAAAAGDPADSPRTAAVLNIDPTCNGGAALATADGWKFVLGDPGAPYGWDPAWEWPAPSAAAGAGQAGGLVSHSDFAGPSPALPCNQRFPPTPPVARLWPLINASVALYNVTSDPGEHFNLAPQYPAVVANLTAQLAAWAQRAAWPIQNGTMDPRGAAALHGGAWLPWL